MPHLDLCQLICSHFYLIVVSLTGLITFLLRRLWNITLQLRGLENSLAMLQEIKPEQCSSAVKNLLKQHNLNKQSKDLM